jgi:hypothetical protein
MLVDASSPVVEGFFECVARLPDDRGLTALFGRRQPETDEAESASGRNTRSVLRATASCP